MGFGEDSYICWTIEYSTSNTKLHYSHTVRKIKNILKKKVTWKYTRINEKFVIGKTVFFHFSSSRVENSFFVRGVIKKGVFSQLRKKNYILTIGATKECPRSPFTVKPRMVGNLRAIWAILFFLLPWLKMYYFFVFIRIQKFLRKLSSWRIRTLVYNSLC